MSVCLCVSKSLPTHFRHIVFNSDPNTYCVLFFILPAETSAFTDGPCCTHSLIPYWNIFPPFQMESLYKEQPSANDFSPIEM